MNNRIIKIISLFVSLTTMLISSLVVFAHNSSPLNSIKATDITIISANEDRVDVYYSGNAFGGLHNLSLVKEKTELGYCYKIVMTENNHEICHLLADKDIKLNTNESLLEFKKCIM